MINSPVARLAMHWAPVIMLVGAYASWPYGYYTLLRLVVCLASALLAADVYRRAGEVTAWCLVLSAIAVLFNPVFPVHLTREIWGVIDPITAVIIGLHYFVSRPGTDDRSPT